MSSSALLAVNVERPRSPRRRVPKSYSERFEASYPRFLPFRQVGVAVTLLFCERRGDLQHSFLAAAGKWQAKFTVDALHLAHGVGGEILQPHFCKVGGWNLSSICQIVHLGREIFAGDDLLLLILGQWRLQGECTLQF